MNPCNITTREAVIGLEGRTVALATTKGNPLAYGRLCTRATGGLRWVDGTAFAMKNVECVEGDLFGGYVITVER